MSTEEGEYADLELLQDIMNTDEIDIIYTASFINESYYKILENKGAFVDLYEFMENDNEVNKNTLNSHVLSLNEVDGKLYSLFTYYTIETLGGQSKYVGDKENWTVDDFINHWENTSGDMAIAGYKQKENVYYDILRNNLESFIDYDNAEVHFDSPEFKKMLEFCNTFESNYGQKGEHYYNEESFVDKWFINGFMDIADIMSKSDYTFVGYPSDDESGAFIKRNSDVYSICAKSSPEKQKCAWDFIRRFFTEEWQIENVVDHYDNIPADSPLSEYGEEHGFCINNNAFEKFAQALINKEYYKPVYPVSGQVFDTVFPTHEDVDNLVEYINNVKRIECNMNRSLWEIINEEIMYYFAGEKTLDECVDLIQNRASIWVSEKS